MSKKKRNRLITLCIVSVLLLVFFIRFVPFAVKNARYLFVPSVTKEQLDNLPLDDVNKLMIVAHPDDEFIWGGGHLLSDRWLVVVITNGDNKVRHPEFDKMMEATGDVGLILSYPDKIGKRRSNWKYWSKGILSDLKTILTYKKWDQICTHNAAGEYGHQHHISAHDYTTELCVSEGLTSVLWYFGTYYEPEDLPADLARVSDEIAAKKEELSYIYQSQARTMNNLRHMLPHENWEKYEGE
ncbi:MAG: PIG-L family deacetylase [Lachnospiraceae bacterium]|nr:PIG-L family deacetylase [Lachnospiraceae bacterium]